MNLAQAIEHASAFVFPGFLVGDDALDEERRRNEEAISLLAQAWWEAPLGAEPFPFDLVRSLADRNREICDLYGADRLRDTAGLNLSRRLSDDDLVRAVAWLQRRAPEEVARSAGRDLRDLGISMLEAPVGGTVAAFDIETTSKDPDRGYVINMGIALCELAPKARPTSAHAAYFGIPEQPYAEKGVPLSEIHHISWSDLKGKTPFRQDAKAQKALLAAFETLPLMAHNAAFEDSWMMLNLNGYAEARKAGKIVVIDTRDICRRIDVDVRSLPRESSPASLENWALRRKTLKRGQKERHLGLDDVTLMLDTVIAEFSERKMFPGQRDEAGETQQDAKPRRRKNP